MFKIQISNTFQIRLDKSRQIPKHFGDMEIDACNLSDVCLL
jgi:hypothetical protein